MRPAMLFYCGDWQRDAALKACSVAARGLWIEMICIMHQAEPYGHLVINGKPINTPVLARMVGATVKEVERWTAELEANAVFYRDVNGIIISRRMVRDERVRRMRAEGGKLGGNPALKDNRKDGAKVGNKVNLPANLQPTPSLSSSLSSSSSSTRPTPIAPFCTDDDAARFARWWAVYPRKVAKQDAVKAWKKLRVDEKLLETMLRALDQQRRTEVWTKENGAYIPHPATWLNGRRWEDETTVVDVNAADDGRCRCGALGVVKVAGRWRCNEHREAA